MNSSKIYFPNLNGLRFIAAFLVIIHHIEQFKLVLKLENYFYTIPFILVIGKLGVVLFFVLSGFLITYLLLAEESAFKKISIGKFYIRRILRIWPLYFLILFLAFVVLPNIGLFTFPGMGKDFIYSDLWLKILLYAFFFPNLVVAMLGIVPYASHTWSIGTEEQFYLVWPVILTYIRRFRIWLMASIVVFYLFFEKILASQYGDFIPSKGTIAAFWSTFNIDCMAIGGIFAILLFQQSKLLKLFLNKYIFYIALITVSSLMIKGIIIPYVHNELYAVLFGLIILNFAANNQIGISLENKVLNYLGNISYGLYMYHSIGIILAISIAKSAGITTNWLIYPLSFILTILIAGLSYRYYESYFLQFKHRFSKIISGNDSVKH